MPQCGDQVASSAGAVEQVSQPRGFSETSAWYGGGAASCGCTLARECKWGLGAAPLVCANKLHSVEAAAAIPSVKECYQR
jgi:hypothetical protein